MASFSALQRAEIAEIFWKSTASGCVALVSVLFNEPKLLKSVLPGWDDPHVESGFSALQRAEIAEIAHGIVCPGLVDEFQCSSTSRNC